MSYMFYAPTRVLFGAGQLSKLHEQTMPGKKAMLVISNGKSTWMSGALDRTTEQLRAAGVEMALFDKVGANPLKSIVEEGADFARSNGCDFVVALGGGSVMDAAKVMAMYAPQPGDLCENEYARRFQRWNGVGGNDTSSPTPARTGCSRAGIERWFRQSCADVCDARGDAYPFYGLLYELLVAEIWHSDVRKMDDSDCSFQRGIFSRRCAEVP